MALVNVNESQLTEAFTVTFLGYSLVDIILLVVNLDVDGAFEDYVHEVTLVAGLKDRVLAREFYKLSFAVDLLAQFLVLLFKV